MLRIAVAALVLVVNGALVAGCGAGKRSSNSTGGPITKAAATEYAHTVNLKASDVPEMASFQPESEGREPFRFEYLRCAGAQPEKRIAHFESPVFEPSSGSPEVNSGVEVWPTAALAAHSVAAITSARGRACFMRAAEQLFTEEAAASHQHSKLVASSMSTLPAPLPHARSAGLRWSWVGIFHGIRVPAYRDALFIVVGPAEITLGVTGAPHRGLTLVERHLLSVLYSRAKAHKL